MDIVWENTTPSTEFLCRDQPAAARRCACFVSCYYLPLIFCFRIPTDMAFVTYLLLVVASIYIHRASATSKPPDVVDVIDNLFDKIATDQVQQDVPFIPLKQFGKKKGSYTSDVKLNFRGKFESAEIRRLFHVPDNNMFVTAWVTSQLLEAVRYRSVPFMSEAQLSMALDFMSENHDHNQPSNTSLMTFWGQSYNSTTGTYVSQPTNLVDFINSTYELPTDAAIKLLEKLGLKSTAKIVQDLLSSRQMFSDAFRIPPDFDDTFVNLGLGSLLFQMQLKFPNGYKSWLVKNNITSIAEPLKRYAYRPFSADRSANTIDPRTYFWLREFLDEAKSNQQDVALVTTWVQDITAVRVFSHKGVAMPFNVNNVDVTVCANTVYGMTSAVLHGMSRDLLDDPQVEQIYRNTTAMIAFAVNTNMSNRVDLALTYYPSRLEFYWFVSRTFAELATARMEKSLPSPVLEYAYKQLNSSRHAMTEAVFAKARPYKEDQFYFDDFLGDADLDIHNRSYNRGEDRLFTTAMAINTLLDSWTTYNKTTRYSTYDPQVPDDVKMVVRGSVMWLMENILGNDYEPWNAFFSGSAKGFTSLPFWYPVNRFEFLNGTAIPITQHLPNRDTLINCILGMEGYVSPEAYKQMISEIHFGLPTPVQFNGYNFGSEGDYFPFWSSTPYTYSSTLLALAKYNSLQPEFP